MNTLHVAPAARAGPNLSPGPCRPQAQKRRVARSRSLRSPLRALCAGENMCSPRRRYRRSSKSSWSVEVKMSQPARRDRKQHAVNAVRLGRRVAEFDPWWLLRTSRHRQTWPRLLTMAEELEVHPEQPQQRPERDGRGAHNSQQTAIQNWLKAPVKNALSERHKQHTIERAVTVSCSESQESPASSK